MGRLSSPPPRVKAAPYRVGLAPDGENGSRPAASSLQGLSRFNAPWSRWYKLARWCGKNGLRLKTFARDGYVCQMCGRLQGDLSKLTCDHVKAHRGNAALFWDEKNLQTLCTDPCHVKHKQKQEQESLHQRGDWGDLLPPRQSQGGSGRMARPQWFRRSHVPLTVVCGPPGAGKSTWVRQHANQGDLIICFDALARDVLGRNGAQRARVNITPDQISDVLRVRNEMLGDLMRAGARARWSKAWLILTEPNAVDRQWWADTLGADIVVLATPANECRRRIAVDSAAGDDRGQSIARTVDQWWAAYTVADCDTTVTPGGA